MQNANKVKICGLSMWYKKMAGCYHDFEVKQTNWMQIIHTTLQQVTEESRHRICMHRHSSKKSKNWSRMRADVFSKQEVIVVNLTIT